MQPKKSLGQNFLKDEKVLEKIISAADLSTEDLVIEIGPGTGILTEKLLKYSGKVIAIEKDDTLAKKLQEKYKNNKKIEIINDDILKINLPEVIEKYFFAGTSRDLSLRQEIIDYKVIANIPYYITSPIIQLFLETAYPPKEMILMVQKEVAERICAPVGKMSILAVAVQYYARPELLFYADKKSFWPVPEVDSAVIRITPYDLTRREYAPPSPYKGDEDNVNFFRIVKAGFSAKRKTLLNNLSGSFHLSKKETQEKIKKAGLDPGQRAQKLSVSDWKKLNQEFLKK